MTAVRGRRVVAAQVDGGRGLLGRALGADLAPPTAPIEPPVTVDLRSDGLADRVRHDDDPPVPAAPVPDREPGRP